MTSSFGPRVLIRNPISGDRKRGERAATIGADRGYEIRESTGPGGTLDLAREAAGEASLVAACGGDGTLNEVVRGVDEAGELDRVDLGVVPAGTGNDFADNIGVTGIEHAFDVMDSDDPRRLDLGMADGRPFINSCVGGLTAEASARTTPEAKRRLGTLAYVLSTLGHSRDFESLKLDVRTGPGPDDHVWSGEATMLLVGNGRRFPGERMRQANMEDGLLNVVVIKHAPGLDYLADGAADRLLRKDSRHLVRIKVPELHVRHDGEPVLFSLDGETVHRNELDLACRPGAMRFHVGERYEPTPREWGRAGGR